MRYVFLVSITMCAIMLLTACGGGGSSTTTTTTTQTPTPTTVELKVVGGAPSAAAVQVNGGAWTALTLSGSGASFTVPATSSTYAVAVLCPSTPNTQVEAIFEGVASDTTTPTTGCPPASSLTMTVDYNVSAVPAASEASISIGTDVSSYWSGANSGANVTGVTPGVQDVAVAAYGPVPTTPAVGVQIERGINVTGAPITVPPMSTADETGSATITVNGVPSGYTNGLAAFYVTAAGTTILLNGNNVSSYALVAADDTLSGDFYSVQSQAVNSTSTSIVEAVQSFPSGQNLTLTLPGVLAYSGPTPAAYPSFNPTYNGFTVTGKTGWIAGEDWQIGALTSDIFVYATAGFLAGNSISIPNLSAVPGFIAPPVSGTSVQWTVVAFSQSQFYFAFDVPTTPPSETAQYAVAAGTFTEP